MSTPAEIKVPPDLLALMRERVGSELETAADSLHWAAQSEAAQNEHDIDIDAAFDRVQTAMAVKRALSIDAEAYPASVVAPAAEYVIDAAEWQINDGGLDVDEAEALIERIRRCEALRDEAMVTA